MQSKGRICQFQRDISRAKLFTDKAGKSIKRLKYGKSYLKKLSAKNPHFRSTKAHIPAFPALNELTQPQAAQKPVAQNYDDISQ